MTRKKVKLAFIMNDSARRASYKKRKKGLVKKMNESTTLCGIEACAIMYSPYEPQPEVWPNNADAQRILEQFNSMPEMQQSKNMVNQESFIKKRIAKASEQLKKQLMDNREMEMTQVMHHCLIGNGTIKNLTLPELNDLGGLVDQTIKDIESRIESLKKGEDVVAPSPPPPPPPQVNVGSSSSSINITNEMMARGLGMQSLEKRPMVDSMSGMGGMQRTQWFTDWMNNPSEPNPSLGPGNEMPPSVGNPNMTWPNQFFP